MAGNCMVIDSDSDDWETLEDNGELEKRIATALQDHNLKLKQKKEAELAESALQYGRVTILQNNEQRTQYTPTITLLKRDKMEASPASSDTGDRKPKQTYEQRSAAYQEARKRILGDDEEASKETPVEILGSEPSSPLTVHRSKVITSEKLDKVIIRQPLGPDGKGGFSPRTKSVDSAS